MRTAILLLIGVALLVLIGSFVPQEYTSQQAKVDEFVAGHHNLDALASRFGLPLTSVFVAPLFLALVVALYVALGACVLRRGRALLVRSLCGYPRTPQYWGEVGSWMFHASFFLLLVAVLYGKATGFDGIMTITEGDRVAETPASYDMLQEGVLANRQHAGFEVQLNSFHVPYLASGVAKDYVSNVSVFDAGRLVMRRDILVNDFLGYRDVDFYQQDFGWAPRILVRNPSGQIVYDGHIQLFGPQKNIATGVLKVPAFGYTVPGAAQAIQLGARLALFPDPRAAVRLNQDDTVDTSQPNFVPGGSEARNPVLQVQLFVGDLGLDRGEAQNVNALDTSHMQPYFEGAPPMPLALHDKLQLELPGATSTQPATFTIEFPELRQYSLFHVKKDNGVPYVYASFALIMIGLLTKLYARPLLEARQARRRGDPPAVAPPVTSEGDRDGSSADESNDMAVLVPVGRAEDRS